MLVRDVMTSPAVTVGPATSLRRVAEVLAVRGFAALPVVDSEDRLLGVIGEADLVRDRVRPDPRAHLRREDQPGRHPAATAGALMTAPALAVDTTADAADAARLLVDRGHRSLPVLEHDRVVGVLSRRDLLRALIRPDDEVAADVLALVERYTGETGTVEVVVADGCAWLVRRHGAPDPDPAREAAALHVLASTVPGVVEVEVDDRAPGDRRADTGTGSPA